jgi:glycosyltransferase involved in cell wall biosynthesis
MSFDGSGHVTVIVCTRDRPERLVGCLAAVNAALRPGDELIVVDSASTTAATREVAEAAGARVVRCGLPGLSRARNLGWRSASHDVVAFTDDDCRPLPSWLHELTLALKRPEIGWTTGSVSVHEEDRDKDRPVAIVPPYAAGLISRSTVEPVGSGNNFAVRVAVLRQVGAFHERLGAGTWLSGAEDIEMFDRLLTSGVAGEHAPEAVVLHQQWRSMRELLRLDWGYGKGQGARLALLRKGDRAWGNRRCRELLWNDGVRSAAHDLRQGYEFGAVSTTIRTLGTLLGLARGLLLRPAA